MKIRYYLNIYLLNGLHFKIPLDLTDEELEIVKKDIGDIVFNSDYNSGGGKILMKTSDTFNGVIAVVWEN